MCVRSFPPLSADLGFGLAAHNRPHKPLQKTCGWIHTCLTFDAKQTTVEWKCTEQKGEEVLGDTPQLKVCAALPASAVPGILTRALLFKTAGRGAAGPYFIMPFKGPIRLQLLNGKACKSYIIHVEHSEKAQEHFSSSPPTSVQRAAEVQTGEIRKQGRWGEWDGKERKWKKEERDRDVIQKFKTE